MIKFCEFCGTFGARRSHIDGNDYSGYFYLCEKCSEEYEEYDLPGKTREEFLNGIHNTLMSKNGPQHSSFDRNLNDWSLLNTCYICHRKISLDAIDFGGDSNELIPEMRPHLPPTYKDGDYVNLCPICYKATFIKMIEAIKEEDLPTYIGWQPFKGEYTDFLNDAIRELVEQRLSGSALTQDKSLDNPSERKCLDVSLQYLTEKDISLLHKRGKYESRKNGYYPTEANIFVIAPYEHGYLVELTLEYRPPDPIATKVLREFGYSEIFTDIIIKAALKNYDYVRFDTAGPFYKEFKKPE